MAAVMRSVMANNIPPAADEEEDPVIATEQKIMGFRFSIQPICRFVLH